LAVQPKLNINIKQKNDETDAHTRKQNRLRQQTVAYFTGNAHTCTEIKLGENTHTVFAGIKKRNKAFQGKINYDIYSEGK